MNPLEYEVAAAAGAVELTVNLTLVGHGQQSRWQGDVVGAAHWPLHFDSLPELIGWLARLHWQTSGAAGVR